jgi:catechol 2,3-dioxygenase-like lactoylglutathione lyase family enzyme
MTPLLVVADLQRSIDFYCEKLGFVEPNVHGDPPCFAMMNRDGFELMLSLGESPADVRPNGPDGTWDLYISLEDVAAESEALRLADVPLVKGPTDTFYDMREIECLDPDGHRICLAQDISIERFRAADVWRADLMIGERSLRLVLKLVLSETGIVGRLDSLDQNAMDLPIDRVIREGSTLHFEMNSIGAAYTGEFSEDDQEIVGKWSQREQVWPLTFRRS